VLARCLSLRVGTALTALVYGMVRLLVGFLLDRLLGVSLILFGSMIDLFVFQNPLATDPLAVARLLPGHYPLQLVIEAGFMERSPARLLLPAHHLDVFKFKASVNTYVSKRNIL